MKKGKDIITLIAVGFDIYFAAYVGFGVSMPRMLYILFSIYYILIMLVLAITAATCTGMIIFLNKADIDKKTVYGSMEEGKESIPTIQRYIFNILSNVFVVFSTFAVIASIAGGYRINFLKKCFLADMILRMLLTICICILSVKYDYHPKHICLLQLPKDDLVRKEYADCVDSLQMEGNLNERPLKKQFRKLQTYYYFQKMISHHTADGLKEGHDI